MARTIARLSYLFAVNRLYALMLLESHRSLVENPAQPVLSIDIRGGRPRNFSTCVRTMLAVRKVSSSSKRIVTPWTKRAQVIFTRATVSSRVESEGALSRISSRVCTAEFPVPRLRRDAVVIGDRKLMTRWFGAVRHWRGLTKVSEGGEAAIAQLIAMDRFVESAR